MSEGNRTSGPTNIYNLPREAYQRYAREQENLAETQKMVGDQNSSMARGAAQLIDTTIKPSEMERLWGLEEKAPIVRVDTPPGYGNQFAPLGGSGEYIFGAASHLSSQEATVRTVQADPNDVNRIVDLIGMTRSDLMDKNGVMARIASLRQG